MKKVNVKGIWIRVDDFVEMHAKDCSVTIEPRPHYCDRGNWLAKLHVQHPSELALEIDHQDGWPRYYMDFSRACLECEEWLKKRKQL